MNLLALGEEYPDGTDLTPLRGANFELDEVSTERYNLYMVTFHYWHNFARIFEFSM